MKALIIAAMALTMAQAEEVLIIYTSIPGADISNYQLRTLGRAESRWMGFATEPAQEGPTLSNYDLRTLGRGEAREGSPTLSGAIREGESLNSFCKVAELRRDC